MLAEILSEIIRKFFLLRFARTGFSWIEIVIIRYPVIIVIIIPPRIRLFQYGGKPHSLKLGLLVIYPVCAERNRSRKSAGNAYLTPQRTVFGFTITRAVQASVSRTKLRGKFRQTDSIQYLSSHLAVLAGGQSVCLSIFQITEQRPQMVFFLIEKFMQPTVLTTVLIRFTARTQFLVNPPAFFVCTKPFGFFIFAQCKFIICNPHAVQLDIAVVPESRLTIVRILILLPITGTRPLVDFFTFAVLGFIFFPCILPSCRRGFRQFRTDGGFAIIPGKCTLQLFLRRRLIPIRLPRASHHIRITFLIFPLAVQAVLPMLRMGGRNIFRIRPQITRKIAITARTEHIVGVMATRIRLRRCQNHDIRFLTAVFDRRQQSVAHSFIITPCQRHHRVLRLNPVDTALHIQRRGVHPVGIRTAVIVQGLQPPVGICAVFSDNCLERIFNLDQTLGQFQTAVSIPDLKLFKLLISNGIDALQRNRRQGLGTPTVGRVDIPRVFRNPAVRQSNLRTAAVQHQVFRIQRPHYLGIVVIFIPNLNQDFAV